MPRGDSPALAATLATNEQLVTLEKWVANLEQSKEHMPR